MGKKLNSYKGRLTVEQIASGMNAAKQNAKRLLDDAEVLLKAKRFPSAASLAVLSIEESGKLSILRGLACAKDNKEIISGWHDYRSHTKKNVAWLLPELVAKGARRLDDFRPLFDKDSDHPFILDQIKQLGFYTDCLGKAHWSRPNDIIDEQLALILIRIAHLFASDTETTIAEIELWIKHMKPVWGDITLMKKAIINWYSEMQISGLVLAEENVIKKFILEVLIVNHSVQRGFRAERRQVSWNEGHRRRGAAPISHPQHATRPKLCAYYYDGCLRCITKPSN